MTDRVSSQDLYSVLWSAADEMRKVMSADVYKDYLLGLTFYKNLSDKILHSAVDLLENREPKSLDEAQDIYENSYNSDDWEDLKEQLEDKFDCIIEPKYTFTNFYRCINKKTLMLSDLSQGFRNIEASKGNFYEGLFSDFNIDSKDLGKLPEDKNKMISSVIRVLAQINFSDYGDDALGDAYEYLIERFASESGKKAGEFYTPQMVASLITQIVVSGKEDKRGFNIYDPCMGSASLLLQVRNYINPEIRSTVHYFGQDINNQTYNLARMNMILHNIFSVQHTLRQGNTLDADWPTDEPTNFDAVVMNPPYSLKYNAKEALLSDPRFRRYEKLPPSSKADYAFLLHGFYHLKTDGVMGIVLPHGVLFRGAAEGTIRKHLLEDGSIYAVIGLPANIFFSTGIPTCVIILKKDNTKRDVLFIDASQDFVKEKARNKLTKENIDKILDAFNKRTDIERYAHLASFEEIKSNDFNLNIPRYVDNHEEEPPIDLDEAIKAFKELGEEEKSLNRELNTYFKELGINFELGD